MKIKHLKLVRFTSLNTLFVLTILLSIIGCSKKNDVPQVPKQPPFVDMFEVNKKIPKIHSHNDYDNPMPFFDAYRNKVYSMEADIWNEGDNSSLVLGHYSANTSRIFKKEYIDPIVDLFEKNNGQVSNDAGYTFILMLDVKTEAYSTLRQVVKELDPFRKYFDRKLNPAAIKVVISGGRPLPADFGEFPDYIYFDGRPDEVYSDLELKRIGFISDNIWNYSSSLPPTDPKNAMNIKDVVNKANAKGKNFRFWGTSNDTDSWRYLYNLTNNNMILIGADYVGQCTTFFMRELN